VVLYVVRTFLILCCCQTGRDRAICSRFENYNNLLRKATTAIKRMEYMLVLFPLAFVYDEIALK
jgi:hypothetical protein